jgi:hypothetical protein
MMQGGSFASRYYPVVLSDPKPQKRNCQAKELGKGINETQVILGKFYNLTRVRARLKTLMSDTVRHLYLSFFVSACITVPCNF